MSLPLSALQNYSAIFALVHIVLLQFISGGVVATVESV